MNINQEIETHRGKLLAALGFFIAWILFLLWIIAHTAAASAHNENHPVTICHATGSTTNPYVTIHVSSNAINGHFLNNGTPKAGHEDDLLLQGTVDCPVGETPPPPPSDNPSHTACVNNACVFVEGEGVNQCDIEGKDCEGETILPPPPPVVQNGGSSSSNTDTSPKAYDPAVCDGQPLKPAILVGFEKLGPGSVKFTWFPSTDTHDKQAIIYGYDENELTMGADNLPADATELTINGLQNRMVFAQIWTFEKECVAKSNILDP